MRISALALNLSRYFLFADEFTLKVQFHKDSRFIGTPIIFIANKIKLICYFFGNND